MQRPTSRRPRAFIVWTAFTLLVLGAPAFADDLSAASLESAEPAAEMLADIEPVVSAVESGAVLFADAEELITSMALVPAPSRSGGFCLSCQTHADCDSLCGVRGYSGGVCLRDGGECYPNEKSCTCF